MGGQHNLFRDEPMIAPRELSRTEDPDTSKEAARHIVRSGAVGKMMQEALAHLRHIPGSTAAELETRVGVSDGRYRKRLSDLRKRGLAKTEGTKKCNVTGRNAQRWWPCEGSEN